ncbi:MAG: T9SS type A sorting domain-containing protein [Bacteroidetes bacterium]|nr:T9SS type A sorting domain-containing protein [Bacteroidota bacterium]
MKTKTLLSILFTFALCHFTSYNFSQSTWTQKANFGGTARYRAVGFSIGTKGYIGTGDYKQDFWEWDQLSNTWTQKADFGGGAREWGSGFSIGTKGYIGTGTNGSDTKDFWEWDQATNVWTQKANFGGTARVGAVGFSIGNKGYIGTGNNNGNNNNDFWEYDPSFDTWTQKTNFGGVGRLGAAGFSIGNKGYIGTGSGVSGYQDFYEYDQSANTWTQKANFPGTLRYSAVAFSIGTIGYLGTGLNIGGNIKTNDFWEWDQANNTWMQVANYGGGKRCRAVGFSIGNRGYVGTGNDTVANTNDFWEFNPSCSVSPASICLVTVDSTNKNVIVWEKPITVQPIDSFRIYREVSSVYKHVGSVPFSSLSVFTDMTTGVNPNIAAYKYEISVKDTCGNETTLSAFHKTIHVAMSPASPCGYNLIWNDYIGFPITQYLIYRDSARTGWKVVDSLSFGNTSWTDGTCYAVSDTIAYLIEALNPAGCTPSIKNPLPMSSGYSSARSNTQQNYANTSVQKLVNDLQINIYPNPTSGQFNVQMSGLANMQMNSIEVYNVFGECIHQHISTSSHQQIDLREAPEGIYFVKIETEQGIVSKKVVLMR